MDTLKQNIPLTNYFNDLIRKYTAFENFSELVNAEHYKPSLRSETGLSKNKIINKQERKDLTLIADCYDNFFRGLGIDKRAFRG